MKTLVGTIVSNKMQQTVVVAIKRRFTHPLYKKAMWRTSRIKAQTDKALQIGDVVKLSASAPISRQKHYVVSEVLTALTK